MGLGGMSEAQEECWRQGGWGGACWGRSHPGGRTQAVHVRLDFKTSQAHLGLPWLPALRVRVIVLHKQELQGLGLLLLHPEPQLARAQLLPLQPGRRRAAGQALAARHVGEAGRRGPATRRRFG